MAVYTKINNKQIKFIEKKYNVGKIINYSGIKKGIEKTGIKNVVFSGGYGLNCVANYHYLNHLKGVNYYVEPISNDAGTAMGAAKYLYHLEMLLVVQVVVQISQVLNFIVDLLRQTLDRQVITMSSYVVLVDVLV